MPDADAIIIGSGAAGAHAACPLLAAGARVLMIDGGRGAPAILEEEITGTFEDMRRSRADQHRWFLGEDFSGILLRAFGARPPTSMIGGNRSYVSAGTGALLPLIAKEAEIMQSLATGGLAAIWGAVCAYLNESTLARMGLPARAVERHYRIVTDRVGIAGPSFMLPNLLPPLRLDYHGQRLLEATERKKNLLARLRVDFLQPPLAVLTRDRPPRRACEYTGLEYYTDVGRAVYRPQFTIDELRDSPHFTYRGGFVAESIREEGEESRVRCHSTQQGVEKTTFTARCIILAAGAIGTARILARSLGLTGHLLPFLSKPHTVTACVHLPTLGRPGHRPCMSLCQLMAIARGEDEADSLCSQLYSYSGFPLFRLLPSLPAPAPEALELLSLLAPSLLLADTRMPVLQPNGTLGLSKDGKGIVIDIRSSDAQWKARAPQMKRLRRAFRRLLLFPVKTIAAAEGSTFHYAGTVPIALEGDAPITAEENGRVRGLRRTFVCDASLFRILPAFPHTLTIMANANRIGEEVAHFLSAGRAVRG